MSITQDGAEIWIEEFIEKVSDPKTIAIFDFFYSLVRRPMHRPSLLSVVLLFVSIGVAALLCMRLFGRLDASSFLVAVATGAVGSSLWFFGSFLPPRFAPSPGASGFVASFVPALFMPQAFFIGVGVVFIVGCSLAGTLFSAAQWFFAKRASNKTLQSTGPKDGAPVER